MQRRTRRQVLAGLTTATAAGVAGCADDAFEPTATATQAALDPEARYGYTHVRPSGNRVVTGSGDLRDADPVTVETDLSPTWLVALPAETGSFWTAVSTLGQATTYHVADGSAETVTEHRALPAGVPPLVRRTADGVGLVRPPGDAAPRTHPVVTDAGPLAVAENGDLILDGDDGTESWSVDALPDGRIVHVGGSRYALFGDATTRYDRGALGDDREGGSLVIVDTDAQDVIARTQVGPPEVIEGISPLVADVNGDGAVELVVTVADLDDGWRVVTYDESGTERARGPTDDAGWRQPLAAADFGNGRELAVTRGPSEDHTVEFYRAASGTLSVTVTYPNVETHTEGSYDTDGAVAGDFDGDGTAELIAPLVGGDSLVAVERTSGGADTGWQWYLDRPRTSNLAGTTLGNGGAAVGVGTENGIRVWQN